MPAQTDRVARFRTIRPFLGDHQMPAQMTATAWRRGATNALNWSFILLVSWLLVAKLISSVSHFSFTVSFWLAWAFLWGLTFLLFLGTWLHGLNSGGRILWDCGPHPTRLLFLINAADFLAMGFGGTLIARSFSRSLAIASPVLGISFGVYWLIMASGRLFGNRRPAGSSPLATPYTSL
jgi:hypothetical protein